MARDDQGQAAEQRVLEPPARHDQLPAEQTTPSEHAALAGAPVTAHEKEKMQQLVQELERQNRRLRKRCEDAELEIHKLERSVKSTENTLSFRLGYALIQSTKSARALRKLPSVLLELSQDARRRRPQSLASSTLAVVAARLSRAVKQQK